jgi:hypothetical protein
MAYIQITNFTGSPSVVYNVVVTSVNPPYTSYTAGTIDTNTSLPVVYGLPTQFDGDLTCDVQLQSQVDGSYSTVNSPTCGVVPPMSYKFQSCSVDLTKNIYVFYDASGSYSFNGACNDPNSLCYAAASVRAWYSDLVTSSGYTGQLYEMAIPSERWLSWPSIPAVGNFSAGTLPGGPSLTLDEYVIDYSTNVAYTTINRIHLGLNLTTGLPDGVSQGLPFSHAAYLTGATNGSFTPDNNYISIVILNESSSGYYNCCSQYYSGILIPTAETGTTSDFKTNYSNWLKTWNNVNNTQSGFTRSFLYYVPTSGVVGSGTVSQRYYGGLYQAIEIMEAEIPEPGSYMDVQYGAGLNLWPNINTKLNSYSASTTPINQYHNFSPLETYNRYTIYSAVTAYSTLDPQYQNGPGLKNFGWRVNGSVTGLSQTQVAYDLNSYITSVLEFQILYTGSDPGYNIGESFKLTGFNGCWQYLGPRLDGQPQQTLTASAGPYADCPTCQATL